MRTITEQDVVHARRVVTDVHRACANSGQSPESVAAALAMELGRHCAAHNLDTTQVFVVFDEVHEHTTGEARKRS